MNGTNISFDDVLVLEKTRANNDEMLNKHPIDLRKVIIVVELAIFRIVFLSLSLCVCVRQIGKSAFKCDFGKCIEPKLMAASDTFECLRCLMPEA